MTSTKPARSRQALLIALTLAIAAACAAPAWPQQGVRNSMLLRQAEQGDAEAQYALGMRYASGLGVRANPAEAAKWYGRAAEQGLAIAQKNLAQLLASGSGVARDVVEAYKWYEISIPNLPGDAILLKIERDELANKMTPAQLAEAGKRAADWFRQKGAKLGMVSPPAALARKSEAEPGWRCDREPVAGATPGLLLNSCLLELEKGRWIRIHRQQDGDAVQFPLQAHGGSAFDTKRGRIVLFGSDTHDALARGEALLNAPLVFDVAKSRWMQLYPPDPLPTYTVNRWGIPVAGYGHDHPWAMHTYGAVEYDTARDRVVVSSHPAHLAPDRFTRVVAHLWGHVRHHPTWAFSFRTNRWSVAATPAESFFLFSTAYDSDRRAVIGYRQDGVFELGANSAKWRRVSGRGFLGGHSNSAYDSRHKAVVVFGSGYDVGESNDVAVYWPATRRHRLMPTPGPRPRPDAHVPMAYHPGQERTVALIDEDAYGLAVRAHEHSGAQTWLYDLGRDAWTHLDGVRLPLGLGMNYNLVYDPGHDILLVVARGKEDRTTVWALRL